VWREVDGNVLFVLRQKEAKMGEMQKEGGRWRGQKGRGGRLFLFGYVSEFTCMYSTDG